jgi:uncharacterized paraquat-inducible protein A
MKNRLIYAALVLVIWYFTASLPLWRLELPGVSSGYSLFDSMSTIVKDNYHLSMIFFLGPIIALVTLINPKKLLVGAFVIYFLVLACGLLGFMFSPDVALKWGWYVHLISMFAVFVLGSKLLPEAFTSEK